MAAARRDLDFDVVRVEDGSRATMLEGAGAFRSALQPGRLALVDFAGHALQ
jgi:hypothetical protein